ncbi:MAG: hypothetical protein IT327_02725 [Anaerolineae bacterium]|nr:hypothetical protein [Anaerolineae bacterium]
MQAIIDYLLEILNDDDEVPYIDVDDVFNFLNDLIGNQLDAAHIVDRVGLYEVELNSVAWEGRAASELLTRLLITPAVPLKGYVVGL